MGSRFIRLSPEYFIEPPKRRNISRAHCSVLISELFIEIINHVATERLELRHFLQPRTKEFGARDDKPGYLIWAPIKNALL